MENKVLNSSESLELITKMISQTRKGYEKGGGVLLLMWGYVSVVVTALVFILDIYCESSSINYVWWLIPIVGYPLSYFISRGREKRVRTYIDTFISYIWIVIGSIAVLFPLVAMFSWFVSFFIIPVESMILTVGIILTGLALSFRPLVIGGCVALALSFLMFFIKDFALVFIAMFVVAMIIPGHILNYRGKCLKN